MIGDEANTSSKQTLARSALKKIAWLLLLLLPSLLLFSPFIHRWYLSVTERTSLPTTILDPPTENLLLDTFIVRDASMSPNSSHYSIIEDELLKRLSIKDGDRISYSVFGTDTFPQIIPAPSKDEAGIAAQRLITEKVTFKTTDFVNLFHKLGDAIRLDREAQRGEQATGQQRPHHADAILIISDGVPDLSEGALRCPTPDQPFVSSEIVEAFDTLVHQKYATQEPLYVRLLIAGTKLECDSSIKQAWETSLGKVSDPATFRAHSYSELMSNGSGEWGFLEQELLRSLRRQPRIILSLMPIQEAERVKLDAGEVFSIQYAALSFRGTESLKVKFGSIEERKNKRENGRLVPVAAEVARLHTLGDPNLSSTEGEMEIEVPPPPPDALWGPVKKGSIYLKLENGNNNLLDSSDYQLRLAVEPEDAFEIHPTEPLALPPCGHAKTKSAVRDLLSRMLVFAIVLGILFACGFVFWALVTPARKDHWISRLHQATESTLIRNWKSCAFLLLSLLAPMVIAGVICAPRPVLLYVVIPLSVAFNLFSFAIEGSKNYPSPDPTGGKVNKAMMINLSLHCVQGIALPLIIEGTAKQLF